MQENPDLTAVQTLLMRERNGRWICSLAHPDWTGVLYNQARAIVTAEIARITYNLPSAPVRTPSNTGATKAHGRPRLTGEFAGAAFRFGHSIVSTPTWKTDEQGR